MDLLEQFQPIFFPRSVAIVGASPDQTKIGTRFLQHYLNAGFKGRVYAVNPCGGRILGVEAYPRVSAIPDAVDLVIVAIPRQFTLDLIEDCARKGVKAVQMFTAGFSELGEEESRQLEAALLQRAREAGIRLIGPNCIGVYSPAHNMPVETTGVLGEPGSVAFICQSGGFTEAVAEAGAVRGLRFSKVVSFGNGNDLGSVDFLEYLSVDPDTSIIGAYLEGVKEGRRLWQLAKDISRTKPLVIYKGGQTEAGAEAAASHTAALAGSDEVWAAALKQAGAIKVQSIEELTDTLLAFQDLPPVAGRGVAIIGQLGGGGGGISVSATDICVRYGFAVPEFSAQTKARLKAILPPVGYILRNPVDLSLGGNDPRVVGEALRLIAAEPGIDLIMVNERVSFHLAFVSRETVHSVNEALIEFRKRSAKPLVVVSPPGQAEEERRVVEGRLSRAGIPSFPTLERAVRALVNVTSYWRFRAEMENA